MPLAEGVSARISYKFYATGVITPGTPPVSSTDPGASGGQILRRVASTLALTKDTYQSNEIRSDRQIADFRHGVKRVAGNISGELSPLTYAALFQASLRSTWVAAVSVDQSVLTSVAADNTASTFTFGGGNPVTAGLHTGMGIRFTGLTEPLNNGVNYIITGFSGTGNTVMAVSPAPTTMAADTSFSVSTAGGTLSIPSTGHVSRKCAVEIYNSDVDIARLFTECRVGGFNIQLPASGIATCDFEFTGRNMELYSAASAPFFTAPTAATTTGLMAAVNGLLRVAGKNVAIVTGLNLKHNLPMTADPVVGSNLVPEIFQGRSDVTGDMTAFFDDATLINDFINETEIEIMAYLTTKSTTGSPAMSFYLPRVKLGGANLATQGEGGQIITLPFQALKYETTATSTSGIDNTTIQIWDSEVVGPITTVTEFPAAETDVAQAA